MHLLSGRKVEAMPNDVIVNCSFALYFRGCLNRHPLFFFVILRGMGYIWITIYTSFVWKQNRNFCFAHSLVYNWVQYTPRSLGNKSKKERSFFFYFLPQALPISNSLCSQELVVARSFGYNGGMIKGDNITFAFLVHPRDLGDVFRK